MSFNHDQDSKLNIYGGLIVENTGGMLNTSMTTSMFRQRLIDQLAANLASDAVEVTETKYTKEHRLQVYVLTPAQLEKYVQRRAEMLHQTRPGPVWVDYAPDGEKT